MEGEVEVSVVIPTFNGEEYLEEVLNAVFSQVTGFDFEVIIIDSGSRDGTLDIVKKFESGKHPLRLVQIEPQEFNHGETRNLGIRKASGDFIAFLTQDATPASETWLQDLRDCFDLDPKVVAVFGKHIPRSDCNPITKREIEGLFLSISSQDEAVVQELKDPLEREKLERNEGFLGFYSDVNSCLRRSFWEQHPYPKVDYAEDQVFGKEVLLSGYKKVYCAKAAVYHSHNYRPGTFLRRYFDEYRGLNISIGYRDNVNLWTLIPATIYGTYQDLRAIWRDRKYRFAQKIYWSYYSSSLNFFRRLGAYLGGRHDRLPEFVLNFLSLERSQKETK